MTTHLQINSILAISDCLLPKIAEALVALLDVQTENEHLRAQASLAQGHLRVAGTALMNVLGHTSLPDKDGNRTMHIVGALDTAKLQLGLSIFSLGKLQESGLGTWIDLEALEDEAKKLQGG